MRLVMMGIMGATAACWGTADTVQAYPLGTRAVGVNNDPSAVANVLNGGGGEFLYVSFAAATPVGTPVTMDSNTWVATAVANTANLGCAIGMSASRATAASQFGWVQVSGQCPVVNNGTWAAGAAAFIQAAGVLSTTVAAGKQVCGARSVIAAAATFTKLLTNTVNGSTVIQVPNTDGIFAGLAVSGTGIAASVVNDIDPGGRFVTLSAACTANGQVTATFTYTNLGSMHMSYPYAQGQIT